MIYVDQLCITDEAIALESSKLKQFYSSKLSDQSIKELDKYFKELATNRLIRLAVLKQHASLNVSSEEEKKLNEETQIQFNQMIDYYGGIEKFYEYFKIKKFNIDNIKPNIYKSLEFDLLLSKLKKQAMTNISTQDIPPERLETYYENNKQQFHVEECIRVAHILIQKSRSSTLAINIEKEVKSRHLLGGEQFYNLAKEFSDCPSKKNGGDLGYVKRNQTEKPFEETAFKLSINEISPLIESKYGWHIIKKLDHISQGNVSLEKAKEQIISAIINEDIDDYVRNIIEKLVQKSKIEYQK